MFAFHSYNKLLQFCMLMSAQEPASYLFVYLRVGLTLSVCFLATRYLELVMIPAYRKCFRRRGRHDHSFDRGRLQQVLARTNPLWSEWRCIGSVDLSPVLKVKAVMDQFREGLEAAGLLPFMVKYTDLMRPLFVDESRCLTASKESNDEHCVCTVRLYR